MRLPLLKTIYSAPKRQLQGGPLSALINPSPASPQIWPWGSPPDRPGRGPRLDKGNSPATSPPGAAGGHHYPGKEGHIPSPTPVSRRSETVGLPSSPA